MLGNARHDRHSSISRTTLILPAEVKRMSALGAGHSIGCLTSLMKGLAWAKDQKKKDKKVLSLGISREVSPASIITTISARGQFLA